MQTRATVVTNNKISEVVIASLLCSSPWIIHKQGGNHDFPVTMCDIRICSQNMVTNNIYVTCLSSDFTVSFVDSQLYSMV